MFKVVCCEFTKKGVANSLSVLDDTDNVVESVTVADALAYIAQGVEIKGITQDGDSVFVELNDDAASVRYELKKSGNQFIRVPSEDAVSADKDKLVSAKEQINPAEKEDGKSADKEKPVKKEKASAKTQKKESTKTVSKPKSKVEKINPLHLSKLIAERILLVVKDNETGKTEEFDFAATKGSLKSEILSGHDFVIEACSDDYLYFVGKDVKISLPSTVVANFSLKDAMLFVADVIVSSLDKDGKSASLLNKCMGKGDYNIQVFAPFSEELGISGQRYEVTFTYKTS